MNPSKLHPNTWQGVERDGGYLIKNRSPKSANAPDMRGRVWLPGVGWYWVSAWTKEGRGDPMFSLRVTPMPDEDARKYCAPKPQRNKAANGHGRGHDRDLGPTTNDESPTSSTDSDIPF